jgi:hypothetical protein
MSRVTNMMRGRWSAVAITGLLAVTVLGCGRKETTPAERTFASPEDAVAALTQAVKSGTVEELAAIFGPASQTIIDSSDPALGRRNRAIFSVAAAERWQLDAPDATTRTLVIGNEAWPFPIPIVKRGDSWRFDAAAGLDEILARRIGRNELSAIRICRSYVTAQQIYARTGHDGRRAGLYASTFRSSPGRHNGLYWAAGPGEKRSPLGDLLATAAADHHRTAGEGAPAAPFHGYYFRILDAQGDAAPGAARSYRQGDELSGGFALVAWPAQYDVTGIMTFIVNHDGIVREQDLGSGTDTAARAMTAFNPDTGWSVAR